MKKKIHVVRVEAVDIVETENGYELVTITEERPAKTESKHAKERELWRGIATVNIPDEDFYRLSLCGGYVESYEQEEVSNG